MIVCGLLVELPIHLGKRTLEPKGLTRSNTDAQDDKPAVSRNDPVHRC